MDSVTIGRRDFLRLAAGAAGVLSWSGPAGAEQGGPPPMRAITRGPGFHWFGYYDKLQFDPTGRYALRMEVEFEGCSPKADDTIRVGMVDFKDGGVYNRPALKGCKGSR